MKRFSSSQIALFIVVVLALGGAGFGGAMAIPPQKPKDLESATGLSTAELVVVASSECQKYENLLGSSGVGTDYQTWVKGMSDLLTPTQAWNYRKKNSVVYDFAKLDLSEQMRSQGAFTLQTLIFEGSKQNGLFTDRWNMSRLAEFYPKTFSTLSWNMANLSLEGCGLTEFALGMQEVNRLAKQVMAQANAYSSDENSRIEFESLAQENARVTAQSYLRSSSFSRSGLISQLQFEGFSQADAVYGTDSLGVDWNMQAAKTAAAYFRSSAFSREGLRGQLIFEGFSSSQADYGLEAVGY